MGKNKYTAIDLAEQVELESVITCYSCDREQRDWQDEIEFAKDLFKEGWRVTSRGNVYCPTCSKKKLKL